jgi:UDP:flavonoid glycosyltransferase YjiC (YdhE family)
VHQGNRAAEPEPRLPAERPLVLVTVGTSVREPEVLAALVGSVAQAGFQVAVTAEPGTLPADPRVREIGFVPLARLLPAVDAVVSPGGSGTVMATLAAGLPAVIRPVLADQPWNAQRVAAAGAGIAVEEFAEVGPAVRTVLTDPAYRTAAEAAADSIRSMPSPDAVLHDLLARATMPEQA